MSQRYEDAVLRGTAMLLLDLPSALRNTSQPLQKLFDSHYPNSGITNILLNAAPVRSTSGDNVMECGAVFFSSPKAMWAILDRLRVQLRTEDGALELRRGYLALGVQEVLVEGVVTWGEEGRPRSATAVTPPTVPAVAPASTQRSETQRSSDAPQTPPVDAPPRSHAHLRDSNRAAISPRDPIPTARESRTAEVHAGRDGAPGNERGRGGGGGGHGQGGEPGETVVVVMRFKEVYHRNRGGGDGADRDRSRGGAAPSQCSLTPFMVYQALAGECRPRKIVIIGSRQDVEMRVTRTLVELENADAAAHVVRVFTRRAVEFVSENSGSRQPRRSRNAPEKGERPICAEVRYLVNSWYSARNDQNRYLPNGERNYHRTISVRGFCPTELDLTDPSSVERMKAKAPREWQLDTHAKQPASGDFGRDSPRRYDAHGEDDRRSSGAAYMSAAAHHPQPQKRRRSPSPRHTRRSPSYSQSRSASTSRSASRSRSATPLSAESSRRDRRRPHDRRRDERRRDGREAAPFVAAAAPERGSHARPGPAPATHHTPLQVQPTSHAQQLPAVREAHPTTHTSASAAPAAAAVAFDAQGPLPLGWRPIFSQEYQQTYYGYTDPSTGTETTTWERPTA
ncbi:hypothetical protein NESM_000390700 [Novymonas esmeraldas]|uniref:WW domain-containing protein n=1 Tax=Novymonas esmeraldas TaxID=1808958 RepID=A0AAW0EN52_9TRYP